MEEKGSSGQCIFEELTLPCLQLLGILSCISFSSSYVFLIIWGYCAFGFFMNVIVFIVFFLLCTEVFSGHNHFCNWVHCPSYSFWIKIKLLTFFPWKFFMLFCRLLIFFQNQLFRKSGNSKIIWVSNRLDPEQAWSGSKLFAKVSNRQH